MKHLIFKVLIFIVFILIIILSDTPYLIKVILSGIMLFFLLPFGDEVFSKERLTRKVKAAFVSTANFVVLLYLFPALIYKDALVLSSIEESTSFFYVVLFSSFLGFFVYGLPVSLLSDWISIRFTYRFAMAAFVHIGFGLLLFQFLYILPAVCAVVFLIVDEMLRTKSITRLNN